MKVSVVLPIYNGEKTLEETLKSLAAQTYQDFELVACIDGTNDGSQEVLENYRKFFSDLKILKNEKNLGLGPTMNRLVANSKGEYIAIAEQDDYYYPDRLQLQVDILDSIENIGLVSGIAEFWNGDKLTFKFPGILVNGMQYPNGEEMFLLNYRNQIKVVNSCIMFKKSVHVDTGLYFTQHYPSISVDWTYILRFSLVSNIYGLQEILVRLDRRTDRTSVTTNKDKQFAAARELLRSFAYEFPEIISNKDYQYAYRTQLLLELGHTSSIKFFVKGFLLGLWYNGDKRIIGKVMVRLNNYFKKQII